MKRILGIDPGYGRLGYAVLEGKNLIKAGCFETSKDTAHEKRLNELGEWLKNLIRLYKPEILAMEKLFFSTNHKTAMRVAEARGTVLYLADGLEIKEFSPPEVKLAVCGYGKAEKKQIERVIRMIFKIDEKLNDDAIDAVAVAFTASGRPT